jgi:hypothetical protein
MQRGDKKNTRREKGKERKMVTVSFDVGGIPH